MGLPISLDDGGKLPLYMSQASKYLRGSVQTEGKYSKLVYLIFEGKTKVLSAVWMYKYMKVRIPQIYLQHVISFFDGTRH